MGDKTGTFWNFIKFILCAAQVKKQKKKKENSGSRFELDLNHFQNLS